MNTTCKRKAILRRASLTLGVVAALGACARSSAPDPAATQNVPPSLVLLTLDTTRADYLGAYGGPNGITPSLDALAARGTRYARALTASPLTLPAHASLMTGLDPPEHGALDNGTAVLDPEIPTLATLLAQRGYVTGAFVSSRVLDRRFGLAHGFDTYDDQMAAEKLGEYGYPERDAAAVTTPAIAWLERIPVSRPYFLWVHYYDPHAPYEPPPAWRQNAPEGNYAGEIAYMDREIGRLLAALPEQDRGRIVVAVGDHGEALGEHGEQGHGIFLYRPSLEVPLILAGAAVPAGQVVDEVVGTRRLAPTLLHLLGSGDATEEMGPVLPGLPVSTDTAPQHVYSETQMPASAYGWSSLKALSDQRWRLIVAPRPELYDVVADPGELRNLIGDNPGEVRRLERAIEDYEAGLARREAPKPELDPELADALRSLGYVSGSSDVEGAGAIDPKDGVVWLAELQRAKQLLATGDSRRAARMMRELVARNPGNVPFLTHLARAELASGNAQAALDTYARAIALNPRLDFLHVNLADAHRSLGHLEAARHEYELALDLNPRSAASWLGVAELASLAGRPEEERRLLLEAVDAGTASAAIHSRLGQIETTAGDLTAADSHFRIATELTPGWALVWLLWGDHAEARDQLAEAAARYERAAAADPSSAAAFLRLGRLQRKRGNAVEARRYLERAVALGPRTAEGREALRLLGE